MSKASALHERLAAVCPISGVSIGRWDDRTSWRVTVLPEASAAQRAAMTAALAAFDPNVPPSRAEKMSALLAPAGLTLAELKGAIAST